MNALKQVHKRSRTSLIAALAAFIVAFAAAPALAGTSYSDWYGPYTKDGYSYYNRAEIYTSTSSGVLDSGRTWVDPTVTVPGGQMGARGRAFRVSTGALACQSSVRYNSGPASSMTVTCSFSGVAGASYYSQGFSYAWNGSGYSVYGTYKSRYQTAN